LTLHSAPLPMAHGFTRTEHGVIPLPAPATLELLARANAPVKAAPGPGELVTPTGAALVVHFTEGRWHQPEMRLRMVGTGAGTLEFPWPNIARLWVGDPFNARRDAFKASVAPPAQDSVELLPEPADAPLNAATALAQSAAGHDHAPRMSLLETNIDDMNPEFYDAISERLFALGARDVWYGSIFMKKNRPGLKLSVLVREEDEARLADILLRESTTLGMRVFSVARYEAERRMETVITPFGEIPVKLKILDGEIVAAVPEYELCKSAADASGRSVREVYEASAAIAWQTFVAQGAVT
jgi:uncharacterized protein (DUF111 family)